MDHFEPLETSRLLLEPVTASAATSITEGDVGALGPAEGWPQPGTAMGIALAHEHGQPPGWLVRHEGRVIGDCGIRAPVDEVGSVEIGYGLATGYQGQGLGSELVVAISDWFLAQDDVVVVRARTDPANTASRRVLEKAGFALIDDTPDACFYERTE